MQESTAQAPSSRKSGRFRSLIRNMAIRHKLMVVIMMTCIIALTLATLLLMGFHFMDARREMVRKLQTMAEMIGSNCQAALAFGDSKDAGEILNAFSVEAPVVYACIQDPDGKLFSHYYRKGSVFVIPSLESTSQERMQFTGDYLRISHPVYDRQEQEYMGSVTVWSDLSPLRQMFRRNLLIGIGILLLVSLAAFVLSSRVQGVISTPLLGLADIARQVSEQQMYSMRATKHGNDEVGVLIDAFNTMLEQIQERDRALVAANEELEVRVEERTAKVSTANEQLKAEIGHRNRAEQTLRERTERIIRHQATLLKLGNLVDTDIDVLCQATVEELSRTLEVERVSIWYVDERHEQLLCQSLFTLGCGRHESGAQMRLADFPRFRQALEASRIVAVDDVLKDQRTSELARYAQPLGITAMMDVPIRLHGKLMGVVCHEHVGSVREWTLEEQDFAGSIADMIMLKMERLERQKAQVALRESERRYRTLLKNIPQRIYYKDLDSVYQLCNESYAEDLKLAQPDDIQGKTDFDLHPEALARQYVVDDQRIMTSGESEEIEESYRQGDRELTIQTLKSPVRDEDGEVIGIFGIFWDITARKEAKLALADLNQNLESTVQELRRSNRELQDFAYVTAHDLKAPLRAIGTLTDWIYSDYYEKLDAQGRDQMQLVKGRVSRMNELIDSILRYSEIGRGSRSLQKINLDTLVSEVIAMIDPPEGYEVRVEGTLPIVVCEKIRLIQVFQNLIGNAIKYMNRPDGRIRVGCVADGDFWRFSVADNGPGIHEKYFEKIFKMFQTLTPRDELESTGIGLAVVKKVVELYGGRVWVESILGEGSVFCFTLPKAAPTTASLQAVAAIAAS